MIARGFALVVIRLGEARGSDEWNESSRGHGRSGGRVSRYLALDGEHAILWMGKDNSLSGTASLAPGKWHLMAATFDGEEFRLYSDAIQVGSGKLDLGSVSPVLQMAPPCFPDSKWRHFGGLIASLTLVRSALNTAEVKELFQKPEDFSFMCEWSCGIQEP